MRVNFYSFDKCAMFMKDAQVRQMYTWLEESSSEYKECVRTTVQFL